MTEKSMSLLLLEVYPNKAFYKKNDEVIIHVTVKNENGIYMNEKMVIKVFKHHKLIREDVRIESFDHGITKLTINLIAPDSPIQGYGVEVMIGDSKITTAFDVLNSWFERPRYGFLSDFYKADENDGKDISSMLKLHINVVQFYDWMYKHEDLIPKEPYYFDLLERELSQKAISSKIKGCRNAGMKTLAYGAIYAASKTFYEEHKEWALYTNDGRPQNLGNWFYIMNIAQACPWRGHIIGEFKKALDVMGFDGIHMDTYGFPKIAYSNLNNVRKIEHLNEQFEGLIEDTKEALATNSDEPCITFNSVSNWAIEEIGKSVQDAVYIEVWDPQETYYHLYQLVSRAKEISHKQVILAAYFKPYGDKDSSTSQQCHNGFLLTSATIFASGGFHFALGEDDGVLYDPYYVTYQKLDPHSVIELQNYYDFIVRYGNLLFNLDSRDNSMTHTDGGNSEYDFQCDGITFSAYPRAGSVWTLLKEQKGYKTIQLINYAGIESDIWNEGKESQPTIIENIKIQALIDEEVLGIYMASPDDNLGHTTKFDYETEMTDRGMTVIFNVNKLSVWNLIYIEVMD